MKNKIFLLITVFSFLISTAFGASKVKSGIEVLHESGFKILQGKRVGLITNPTGVDSQLKSTVDILNEASGVKLVALYGPEHGVRGDEYAGDKVETTKFYPLLTDFTARFFVSFFFRRERQARI